MAVEIPPVPDEVADSIDRYLHPPWRARMDQITADSTQHGVWKVLETYTIDQRHTAANLRKSLSKRYGNVPSILGYQFATRSNGEIIYVAVRYTPELKVDEAYKKWAKRKRGIRE